MPEEIVTALARVASTLPPVHWPEPEEIRRTARGRQRRRAVAASFVAVLVVGGGFGLVRELKLPMESQPGHSGPSTSAVPATCPGGLVPANLHLPDYPDIQIQMYNGTLIEGLAEQVGNQLKNRGLTVLSWRNASSQYDGIVRITYGPGAVGAAWVMQSFFVPDGAEMVFDVNRRAEWVDITLGTTFQELETPVGVNRNLASHGSAALPPGTCGAD